jgi:hypothetical protein
VVGSGKLLHRTWVADVFHPQLDARPSADSEALLDRLVVATDVYTWQPLRRDRGPSRANTQARMLAVVTAILRRPKPFKQHDDRSTTVKALLTTEVANGAAVRDSSVTFIGL